jgi:hypothetical protein
LPVPGQSALDKISGLSKAIWDYALGPADRGLLRNFNGFLQGAASRADRPVGQGPKRVIAILNRNTPVPDMTQAGREKILDFAKKTAARDDVVYSQDPALRTGPDSFDCSGFVAKTYEQAGFSFGSPSVAEIVNDSAHFTEVSDPRDAQAGDLVVHLKKENQDDENASNHVGIFTGTDSNGAPTEISAQIRGGHATGEKNPFKSSIQESRAKSFGKHWRIFRWKKLN